MMGTGQRLGKVSRGDRALHCGVHEVVFSAFPDVYWCISNDREIVEDSTQSPTGRQVYAEAIRQIGRDLRPVSLGGRC